MYTLILLVIKQGITLAMHVYFIQLQDETILLIIINNASKLVDFWEEIAE